VQLPWRSNGATTSSDPPAEQTKPPAERTSVEWAEQIRVLRHELETLAQERTTLTGQAGRAVIDGHGTVVTGLQGTLAAISTRETIVSAAIDEATRHKARAQRREEREALVELERAYYRLLSAHCESRARVRDAEANLVEVERVERQTVDQAQLGALYDRLLRAGRTPEPPEQPEVRRRDAGGYRADAERYRARAGITAADEAVAEEATT